MRRPGESISQYAIRTAWELGHFWAPDNPDGWNLKQSDLSLLRPEDTVVIKAMRSLSQIDASRYTRCVLEAHGRQPVFDGVIGPAMKAMVSGEAGERCPVPDHAPPQGVVFAFEDPDLQKVVLKMQRDAVLPAFGSGNWKGCHGVGQFHCASIRVNQVGLPAFLQPVFRQVLTNVQKAYAGVGLLFRFVNMSGVDMLTGNLFGGTINSEMSFVGSSSGWIGLAIVGQGETCGSTIWCKFLATYKGGSDNASIITQWTTLLKHELGHNCGRGHTTGGVMNPSIVNNLPIEWGNDDPSTSWLRGQFGGVPVPISGTSPGPGPGPTPDPPTVEKRLLALEVKNVVQDVMLNWCVEKLQKAEQGE